MKNIVLAATLVAGSASAAPPSATGSGFPGDMGRPTPEGPAAKAPSIDLALEAAKAAVEACKGYHVGISVIDANGAPKLYYIPDGTGGSHAYTGFRKAYAALTFKMPTSQVSALAKTDSTVAAKIAADTNLLSWAGGIPLKVGDEVIGAIGVSGAEPSSKDEECGLVGVNKIKDRLK